MTTLTEIDLAKLKIKEDRKRHQWGPNPIKGVTFAKCGFGPWDGRYLNNSLEHDICEVCRACR